MKKLYHKKNELLEVEFYQDKCTQAFDFTNEKDLYIELKDGDVLPLFSLVNKVNYIKGIIPVSPYIYVPYIPKVNLGFLNVQLRIKTLDDITPNLSKYIPEDNAVLFLSEDIPFNKEPFTVNNQIHYPNLETFIKHNNEYGYKKLTIFLRHGTQAELQKANKVAKELKEKYGVEEVNLFVLHCFRSLRQNDWYNDIPKGLPQYSYKLLDCLIVDDECITPLNYINKLITTNSTGVLEPQNSERLQVIDCFEIFKDYEYLRITTSNYQSKVFTL